MKHTLFLKALFFVTTLVFAGQAMAVKPNEEEPKECKKPKFRDFEPPHKAEVAPESEITFHVSRGSIPTSVTLDVRDVSVPVEAVNRKTYISVVAKMPASIRDGYARIHVTAKAEEGECMGQDGWLVKIVDPNAPSTSHDVSAEPVDKVVEGQK